MLIRNYIFGITISLLLTLPVLLPNLILILESPRMGTQISEDTNIQRSQLRAITLLRFFSNDITKVEDAYRGYENYLEDPINYLGLLPIILFTQQLRYKNKKRQTILYFGYIAFLFLYYLSPHFRASLSLFTNPYFKTTTAFVILPILLIFSVNLSKIVSGKDKINIKYLLITLFSLVATLYYYKNIVDILPINQNIYKTTLALLISYTLLMSLKYIGAINMNIFRGILLIIVVIELVTQSNITINERSTLENYNKTYYKDGGIDMLGKLKKFDPTFYRIDKNYNTIFLNDNLVQDFKGTKAYQSFNHPYTINFLDKFGLAGKDFQYRAYVGPGVELNTVKTIMGVKYILSDKEISPPGYEVLFKNSNHYLYKNIYSLPNGFVYDNYILEDSINKLPPHQLEKSMAIAVSVSSPIECATALTKTNLLESIENFDYPTQMFLLKSKELLFNKYEKNYIQIINRYHANGIAFVPIPWDYGWNIYIDGRKTAKYNINYGYIGFCLNEKDINVELKYNPIYFIHNFIRETNK